MIEMIQWRWIKATLRSTKIPAPPRSVEEWDAMIVEYQGILEGVKWQTKLCEDLLSGRYD